MTLSQMIQYLRLNVNVQDPENPSVIDPKFLAMTDADLELFVNVALAQNYFQDPVSGAMPTIETVPGYQVMLLMLYAKRELYFALAVKVAPLEDLGADNNNYIKRDQRFQHYIKLIGQVDDEISGFLNDGDGAGGGGGTNGYVLTYNTTLVDRYATAYNYRALKPPTVSIVVSGITPHSVEIAWKTSYISKFLNYRVWAGKESIYDPYTEAKISEGIKPIFFSRDPHSSMVRITDLEPNTNYYFVVGATNASDLTGYTQTLVTTLEEVIP